MRVAHAGQRRRLQVGKDLLARSELLDSHIRRLPGAVLHSPVTAERRSGILTFSLEGWDNRQLFERLKTADVVCAQRGPGIRLSPHFYTSEHVLEQTLDLIGALARF